MLRCHSGEIDGKHLLSNWSITISALRKHPRTGDDLNWSIWVRLLLTRPSRPIAQLNAAQFAQHVRRTTEGSLRGSTAAANSTNLRLRRPRTPQGPRSERVLQRTSSQKPTTSSISRRPTGLMDKAKLQDRTDDGF